MRIRIGRLKPSFMKTENEKQFDKEKKEADLAYARKKFQKDNEADLQKLDDDKQLAQLKRNKKQRYLKAEYTDNESTEDLLARKTLYNRWILARFNHITGAVVSWLLSGSYWYLLLLLSVTSYTEMDIGEINSNILFIAGFLGGMGLITVLELTKFSAQAENVAPKYLIAHLTAISLLTTTGKFMNDAAGASATRAKSSQNSQDIRESGKEARRIYLENVWAYKQYPNANTIAKVEAEREDYLNQEAVNVNGRKAGFTNAIALARGYRSYASSIERKLTTNKNSFDNRIAALQKYYSVIGQLDKNGNPKQSGAGGILNTGCLNQAQIDAGETKKCIQPSGDAMIDALAQYLGWNSLTMMLIFYLFVSVGLELAGRYNGTRSRKYRMMLDGLENVLKREYMAKSLRMTAEEFDVLMGMGNPQQQVLPAQNYSQAPAQPAPTQPTQSVTYTQAPAQPAPMQQQQQTADNTQAPSNNRTPQQQDNWRPFYFEWGSRSELCLTPQKFEQAKKEWGEHPEKLNHFLYGETRGGHPVFALERVTEGYNGMKLTDFLNNPSKSPETEKKIKKIEEERIKQEKIKEQQYLNAVMRRYSKSRSAKAGSVNECPICRTDVEKVRTKIYCSKKCADEFHNLKNPDRKQFIGQNKKGGRKKR